MITVLKRESLKTERKKMDGWMDGWMDVPLSDAEYESHGAAHAQLVELDMKGLVG